jgi:acetolactate synthase-1/2/3 large subunit
VDPSVAHVGDLLVELLRMHRVEVIFGLPGGQTAALYDAVARAEGITHVVVRDEQSGAYAADAYARVTGRIGVCDATVGPGTAKLPSGLGEALNSSIPILAIVSELSASTEARRHRGATSQAMDQEALLRPVTKWLATVRRQEDLAPVVRRAFREATSGRPGPVAIILPQDLLDSPRSAAPLVHDPQAEQFGAFPAFRIAGDAAKVREMCELMTSALRPAMILGGGAASSDVAISATSLADLLGCAVATTFSGKGAVDERHPLSVGVVAIMGTASAQEVLRRADLLILVGTKAGSVATLGYTLPASGQRVIQVDIDPAELGRDFVADATTLGDAGQVLEQIVLELETFGELGDRADWRAEIQSAKSRWESTKSLECLSTDIPVTPQRVMGELEALLGADDVLVADASLVSGWVGSYVERSSIGRRTLFPRGLGGLGWALPAAIGAATARPRSRVIAVMGDGAIAYSIGEFATLAQLGLNIKVIVLNNSSYGWIRWYRRVTFGREWQKDDLGQTNFQAVGAAYGFASIRVENPEEVGAALAEILDKPGPGVVEIISSVWETPVHSHRSALLTGEGGTYGT